MLIIALLQYRQDQLPCGQDWIQPHRLTLGEILHMALAFIATRLTDFNLSPESFQAHEKGWLMGQMNSNVSLEKQA